MNRQQLKKRIIHAAENILQSQHYVRWIDVLLTIGWLQSVHVDYWRKGKINYLEHAIQANLNKLSYAMKCFQQWAIQKGLKPSETQYLARTREPKQLLQFSKSGQSNISFLACW